MRDNRLDQRAEFMFNLRKTTRARNSNALLHHVAIDQDLCNWCGACVSVCPPDSLFLYEEWLAIDHETCTRCERCVKMCPVHALHMAAGSPESTPS
ncbi:MAG: 4Fe-4S binding protein [Chloroflexi bacterium]|nr:4Fe-4S binding protein [Chloroflexota bacterium]MCY4010363.1 4Fe-4S binding protein [Anaerolineaceae bacterium]MCY4106987.1 4Fe-4S binding protein [Chloroflexota bacterium]